MNTIKAYTIMLIAAALGGCATTPTTYPEATVTTEHIKRVGGELLDAPEAITGVKWNEKEILFFGKTSRVPLIKEHGLGVIFDLHSSFPEVSFVDLKVTYPRMYSETKKYPGLIERKQKIEYDSTGRYVSFAYYFDEDWELVEGIWNVTISLDDAIIGSAEIETYHP
ncbi:MAG: hypothetical protein AAF065_06170 [Verrucomicrobiota bacterium]